MNRLPYKFDEELQAVKQLSMGPKSLRDSMLEMPDNEFRPMLCRLNNINSFLREFQATMKAVAIERRNDYDTMIIKASKKFNAVDIAVLELLAPSDESAYYLRGIVDGVREALDEPITEQTVKKSVQLLKRRGLIEVIRGLFDEDGFTAGSGYQCVYHKHQVIERIIANYHGRQLELVKETQ